MAEQSSAEQDLKRKMAAMPTDLLAPLAGINDKGEKQKKEKFEKNHDKHRKEKKQVAEKTKTKKKHRKHHKGKDNHSSDSSSPETAAQSSKPDRKRKASPTPWCPTATSTTKGRTKEDAVHATPELAAP